MMPEGTHVVTQTQITPSFGRAALVWLVLWAFVELLRVDLQLLRGFPVVYEYVRRYPVRNHRPSARTDMEICHAVDLASVFYFKPVRCLQRSAAAATLLRLAGYPAEMVIGVQPWPFRAHAWVEVSGRIVNDKPYTSDMYTPMERC